MNGTPKQIAWAMRIRIKHLPALKWIADMFQHNDPATQSRVRDLATRALKEQDSTFWIGHRNDPVDSLLKDQERRMSGSNPNYEGNKQHQAEADAILGKAKP